MAELRTQDKRDKLRIIFADVKPSGKTIADLLLEGIRAADAAMPNGSFLSSTSEAGGSVSFSFLHEYSPVVARRLFGELADLNDKAVAYVGANEMGNQQDIYNRMMSLLVPVRRIHKDFTGLRFGTSGMGGLQ